MEKRDYCVYKHTTPDGKVYVGQETAGFIRQIQSSRWRVKNMVGKT